jgi:exodeoxyribonuclease VII small subunit
VVAERKKTPASKISFGDAVAEVEGILDRLEGEDVDIDDLSREVKRAVELLKMCRDKLERTDGEVRELVAGLGPEEAGPAPGAEDADPVVKDKDLPF